MQATATKPEAVEAQVIDAPPEGEVIDATATTPETELKPAEPDDGDTAEDGDDEPGPLYDYVVLFKNGHVTNHADERNPAEIAFDHKMSMLYPLTPKSAFNDDEWELFERLQKEDPKRYQRKDAKLYLFQVGFGSGEDDEQDELANLDPREIQAIIPADAFGPPPPPGMDDYGDDDDEDDDAPSSPGGGGIERVLPRINGAQLGPPSRRGRKGLRDRLGR